MTEPIPERFLELLLSFLRTKKSGQVVLNIRNGEIMEIDIKQTIRIE